MPSQRLEVRLDEERRRRLEAILAARGAPMAAVIREMIDRTYEEVCREERRKAALELAALTLEDVPAPEVLSRQLDETYGSAPLC